MRVLAGVVTASLLAVAGGLVGPGTASASVPEPGRQAGGLAAAARNVELRAAIPETEGAVSINFLQYRHRDVMFLSGTFGLKTYDVTDADRPRLLDHLTKPELALPGDDPEQRFWENEDVTVDPNRKLVFLARERSAFGRQPGNERPTGVYFVSAADPERLELLSFQPMGTGHITTCVNDCSYLWTTGYDGTPSTDPDTYRRSGKVFVTDIRDPREPVTLATYVDLNRNQGETHMTHDVQVDAAGIAWVAGTGGTRGYHTRGWHRDPLSGQVREATAYDPIPYAGGAAPKLDMPTSFSHNSFRPVGRTLKDGPKPSREHPAGSLLLHTEEAFGSATCEDQGRFVISSLEGSTDGESWRATPERPFHLKTVGVWSPDDQEGTLPGPDTFCSAHYFDVHQRIVAYSWYEQGTRFLDITDPAHPIQVAYWRPEGAVSFAPYWHRGRVFVADLARGVEVVKLTTAAYEAQATHTNVGCSKTCSAAGSAAPSKRRSRIAILDSLVDHTNDSACSAWPRPWGSTRSW
ncbi:LVIVD repeat-containing protein [Saccharothrix hoggarensis]|uniref:LVIVD repeat-containing protein n=1 Tax=Saccharothrix hoggarensis TaxID=913853 RepID=A0ABW3R186_9PSEU